MPSTQVFPPQDRRRTPVPRADSPRLARLTADVRAGARDAVPAFWAEVAERGSPLVEPHLGGYLVTFCCRAPGADQVLLLANKVTDLRDPETARMDRLAGTDVWHVTFRMSADWRATYRFAAFDADGYAALTELGPRDRRQHVHEHAFADPHNRLHSIARGRDGYVPASLVELPAAPPQPWRAGPARGELRTDRVPSEALGEDRRVWVYEPAGTAAGLVVFLDGEVWAHELPVLPALDRLAAPLRAVFVDAGTPADRWRDLSCREPFVEFLADELLPRLPATPPSRTVLAGQSLGGLTAGYAATGRPDAFGNVLAQSSSLWWPHGTPSATDHWPTHEWLTHQLVHAPELPPRWYVEVGGHEWQLVAAHRRLRDVLVNRSCETTYTEYNGGHDYACWRGGLATGLDVLTADW